MLRAAGAGKARLIAVCIDDPDNRRSASSIWCARNFPAPSCYVRSYDRRHTLRLIAKGVDFELRETFESALVFGRRALEALGLDPERAQAVEDFVRARDLDRLALQQAEGVSAGLELLQTRMVQPEPLSRAAARRPSRSIREAEDIIRRGASLVG